MTHNIHKKKFGEKGNIPGSTSILRGSPLLYTTLPWQNFVFKSFAIQDGKALAIVLGLPPDNSAV